MESVKRSGLPLVAKLLIEKAGKFARFTREGPELLDFAELGRLVLYH